MAGFFWARLDAWTIYCFVLASACLYNPIGWTSYLRATKTFRLSSLIPRSLHSTSDILFYYNSSDSEPDRSNTPVNLAGVDSVIEDCKTFCVLSYMMHATRLRVKGGQLHCLGTSNLSQVAPLAPGLLVTGRSGSGKTSILRAAAKALQEDPRTLACGFSASIQYLVSNSTIADTLYVDLAKYAETPVPKVKTLLNYWFDKAYFHKPTVVILDNVDKLMGAEQEVYTFAYTRC